MSYKGFPFFRYLSQFPGCLEANVHLLFIIIAKNESFVNEKNSKSRKFINYFFRRQKMLFSVERTKLLEAVLKLQSVVGAKSSMPVLEGILISAEKGKVTLIAYNLEMGIKK